MTFCSSYWSGDCIVESAFSYDYYEVVFDQKIETWIQCHINAFKYFGGVPKVIKLDNLKAGIIDANFYEPIYQKEYKQMADHYNCLLYV